MLDSIKLLLVLNRSRIMKQSSRQLLRQLAPLICFCPDLFWPSQLIMGVKSVTVWEHETGHESDQWLPRKLWNTAICPMPCADYSSDLNSQYFQQLQIALKPSFVFMDRIDTRKGLQKSKTFCGAHRRRQRLRHCCSLGLLTSRC
jgi:hypothetical protein